MSENQLKLDIVTKKEVSDKMKEYLGTWTCLYPFFESDEWLRIKQALKKDMLQITPEVEVWFRAFKECHVDEVSVVWLGLSPYYGKDAYTDKNIADGLAFSTSPKHTVPPSLFQVYKGLEWDLWKGINRDMDRCNDLTFLANQGVLLLNSALTTTYGSSEVHLEVWKPFIRFVIKELNKREGIVFVGFGKVANELLLEVDRKRHVVFEREHPAAAARGNRYWAHEKVFTLTNKELQKKGIGILWDRYQINLKT